MWEIPNAMLNFQLSEGFSLWEDPDFVYLKRGEEIVACFRITQTSPAQADILRAIENLISK